MPVIVHVGSSKTGTTTLQSAFFPEHPGLFHLGKTESYLKAEKSWANDDTKTLLRDIYYRNHDFAPHDTLIANVRKTIDTQALGRPISISDEGLCEFTGVDSKEKLRRLQTIFGDYGPIKIILGVRNQLEILRSNYITIHRSNIFSIGNNSNFWYPTFDQYIEINFRYVFCAYLESYKFYQLCRLYEAEVGTENIFIYDFNEFKQDGIKVLRRICEFIGIDPQHPCLATTFATRENERPSARVHRYFKLRKHLFPNVAISSLLPSAISNHVRGWIGNGQKFDIPVTDETRKRLESYYSEDNQALATTYGITL